MHFLLVESRSLKLKWWGWKGGEWSVTLLWLGITRVNSVLRSLFATFDNLFIKKGGVRDLCRK